MQPRWGAVVYPIPDLDVSPTIDPGPDGQHVLSAPYAENGAANLVAGLRELVTDHGQEEILPVPIGHSLLQPNHPFSTLLVGFILPHGTDALLENMVIGDGGKERGPFQVGVYRPEALYRGYRREGDGGFFVVRVFRCGRAVPDHPGRLEQVVFRRQHSRALGLFHEFRLRGGIALFAARGFQVGRSAGSLGGTEGRESSGSQAEGGGSVGRRGRDATRERGEGVEGIRSTVGAIRTKTLRRAGNLNSSATLFSVGPCHRQRQLGGATKRKERVN